MFFLSSRVLQLTCHLQGIPLQPFHHFSDPSFSALVPLGYSSTTPTLNTFVPLTKWSTPYSPFFVRKTHRVMSRLVRMAVDLAALHLLAYPLQGHLIMLPEPAARSTKHKRLQSRRGTRTVRVVSVWRNIRMYAPDPARSRTTRPPSGVADPKYIRIISRLGASGSTNAQAEAAIRRQFQEAHRPSP